jgi:sugar phosphate isomerase/epimerase
MKMRTQSRRDFLRQSAIAAVSTAFLPDLSLKKKKFIGVQLYSVRDDMKKDPLSTLKKIAEMGYKNVEHANYINRKFYGWSAKDFKKVLDDLGLKMPSGHTVMGKNHWDDSKKEFTDAWKYTVEDAAICGQKYVISPWLDASLRTTQDDLKRYMEVFNKSGMLCQKSGMKFGYHNHHFEFAEKLDGITIFDIIMKNTDPNLVAQQLDIGNMYNGGAKAQDILAQYPGRFELMHVKDEIEAPAGSAEKYESSVFGAGVINVKEVIDLGKKMGKTIHFIVEQESYQGKMPLDSVKEDLAIMKKWGY